MNATDIFKRIVNGENNIEIIGRISSYFENLSTTLYKKMEAYMYWKYQIKRRMVDITLSMNL